MLKITRLFDEPALSKNHNSRLVFSSNNNNTLAFGKNDGNDEINRFGIGKNGMMQTKKLGKLSKSGKSKSKKMSKS